ncbi:MAG: Rieske (2Fe-2S) protein [Myxococcota bacterium]|nr:Rieske (2Fe-2S) protein [Myxococcota bacterium]
MTAQSLDRRRFLILGGGTMALTACSSASVTPAQVGDVPAMNVSSLTVGTLEPIGNLAVCLGRDAKGVYAMTLTCTHMGCTIGNVTFQKLTCQCHSSQFDGNGSVVSGPATQSLQHFAVTVDASSNLTIHGGQLVTSDTRLVV